MRTRGHRLRVIATAAVAIASLAVLSACSSSGGSSSSSSSSGSSSGKPVSGGTVTFASDTEPVCWNPQRSGQQNSYPLIRNYAESLIAMKATNTYVPWLATSWDVSKDGLTYTFHLKKGVKFSDGETFDANVVKQNFDFIANAKNAEQGALALAYYDHSTAVDADTFQLVLKKPDSTLLESISSIALAILAPKTLAAETGSQQECNADSTLIGTGPFTIGTYTRGQSISFDKNPDYSSAPALAAHTGPAYLDSVTYRFLTTTSVREAALTSGQVDAIEGVQATDVARIKGNSTLQYLVGPSTDTAFSLNINYKNFPADDVRVRQALRDGFDLSAIVKSLYLGTVDRAWTHIGPDTGESNSSLKGTWGNNVKAANKLLDEAGWTQRNSAGYRTKDGKQLTISVQYPTVYVRDNRDKLLEEISAQLKQNIGMDLDVQLDTSGDFTTKVADGTWGIYPDTLPTNAPVLMLAQLVGSGSFLYAKSGWDDTQIDEWLTDARTATTAADRKKYEDLVQQREIEQGYVLPLYYPTYNIAAKKTVHGLGFEWQLNSWANAYDWWVSK